MKTFIINYGHGNISVAKAIKAKNKTSAIKNFIDYYDQFDITKNEVDIFEFEQLDVSVETIFNKLKEMQDMKK